ncbi:MAG: APC family permease [Caulobacteraceae bacterium]
MSPPGAFPRSMKIVGVLLLTLSAVTPASSVFVILPSVIQQAGSGALVSLIGAAVVSLAMAFVYAELASAWPLAGGEYAMAGRALGPFVGFVLMGANTVAYTLVPPVLGLGAASYLAVVWPGAPAVPIAAAMIALGTLLGILNIRLNAWVTGLFLVVEALALVVVAALGFSHPARPALAVLTHPVIAGAHGALAPAPAIAIGLSVTVAIFAYNGYGAAVYFSEEMHEAPRRIARTILLALAITLALEFLPTAAVVLGAPDLSALIRSPNPFGDFVAAVGGRALAVAVSLGVALAIVNAVIASLLINARILFASGRDRAWHGAVNGAFTRLHPRFASPWIATLATGAAGVGACFIPFHLLLVLNGMAVVATYISLCAAAVVARLSGASAHAPYRMPLFPLAPAVGLVALAGVVAANWSDPDVGRPSLIATLAVMILFALYYLLRRSAGGLAWTLTGPVLSPQLTTDTRNLDGDAS